MSALPVLTTSRQSCASRCQREHHYAYRLGYRPVRDAESLRFGTLVHLALEAWWLAAKAGEPDELRLAAALTAMEGEADPFDRARAEAMVYGYDARWSADLADYEVLAVEAKFETPLINPETGAPSRTWVLGGKIDLVLRHRASGRIIITDHKTASVDIRKGSDFYRRLRIDRQVSTYYSGAAALGFDAQEWMHDVLAKPAQRPLKATPVESRKFTKDGALYKTQRDQDETPDEYRARVMAAIAEDPEAYFQRATVVRLETELEEAAFDAWQTARQLREAELAGRYPRNPDACVRYGSTCSYFPVCTGEAQLEDPTLYRRIDTPNPELAETASAAA